MKTESTTDRTWQEDLRELLPSPQVLAAGIVLAGCFVWFYWSSIGIWPRALMPASWKTPGHEDGWVLGTLPLAWLSPDYQHGWFVPLFCLYLLWVRRAMFIPFAGRGSWWGLAFFAVWAVMRWAAVYFNFESLPEYSMLPFLAGLALFAGGWQALHWAWPSIVFLGFMIRLPGDVQSAFSMHLQEIATRMSVYTLQTLGITSMQIGHVIDIGAPEKLNVAEACSGLRMMMMFFAMCVGASFLMRKPVWERLLIVGSAPIIAILANVTRIVVTAICYNIAVKHPSLGDPNNVLALAHDWAGFIVEMPIGLLFLWIELTLLSKLLISPLPERPLVIGGLAEQTAPVIPTVPRRPGRR